MSFSLGALVSSGVGAAVAQRAADEGTNLLNTAISYNLGKRASGHNYRKAARFQAWQALNLPSLQMQGLQNAGLNPILAYGNVGAFPSADFSQSAPSVPSSGSADFVGAMSAKQMMRLQSAQERQIDSQIALNAVNARSVAERTQISRDLANAEIELKRLKAVSEGLIPEKIRSEIERNYSQLFLDQSRDELMRSNISLNAKRLSDIESMINYRTEQGKKSWFGWPGLFRIFVGNPGPSYGVPYYQERGVSLGR